MDIFALTKVSTNIAKSVSQNLQAPSVSHFVGTEAMVMPMGGTPMQQKRQNVTVSDVLSFILFCIFVISSEVLK